MTERCAVAALRLKNSPTPFADGEEAPSHHQLLLTLLRTCAFDVDIDKQAKEKMLAMFVAHVNAAFPDCKQVYQQLFVSKSRLLASPIVVASSEQRAKFSVPSCNSFLSSVLVETAKVAIGAVDYYATPDSYEKHAHKISIRFTKAIKGILNASMPSWSASASAPAPMPEIPAATETPQPQPQPQPEVATGMAVEVPPLTAEQSQILAQESLAPAAPRRLNFDPDQSWQ